MSTVHSTGRTYAKNFSNPDESHEIPNAVFSTIRMEGMTISHAVMQPGWSWDDHVKPIVGGDSCQFRHFGYIVSGRLHVRMNDGTEANYGPGDVYLIEPGQTGWIAGDEPAVSIEFTEEAAEFGKAPGS